MKTKFNLVFGSNSSGTQRKTFALSMLIFFLGGYAIGQSIFSESEFEVAVRGKSINNGGVVGESTSSYGVYGGSSSSIGVYGYSVTSTGITGFSNHSYGASFRGSKDGGYADIVLRASSVDDTGDDGIIRSDPDVSGSDILLQGNDAVVARIDFNNNGTGNFFVRGQNNTILFRVAHDGTVSASGGFTHNSDRNLKEQIDDLSYGDVLKALQRMPIYKWQYKGQARKHIGPMAQDFHLNFGLGDDDTTICTLDANGVALAAIKAQQEIIEGQQLKLDILRQEVEILNNRFQKIDQREQEMAVLKKKRQRGRSRS
ncbi:MAG: tail fiber domain-containing protein [Saprospiraceae bacterium]|nr:tail fiber domain-containing protein [Saprospiraceae bacterium]